MNVIKYFMKNNLAYKILINLINITTNDIKVKILFIDREYNIIHRKSR